LLNNLVVELTRLGIENRNLKMRVESLNTRLDFAERRGRALEGVVQYKAGASPVSLTTLEPVEGGDDDADKAGRRKRRRRGRRRGGEGGEGGGEDNVEGRDGSPSRPSEEGSSSSRPSPDNPLTSADTPAAGSGNGPDTPPAES
jgi:hypothetical protein